MEMRIDGRAYTVQVRRQITQPEDAVRLVVVAYQPNKLAKQLLRVCIQSIQRYTQEPHELWVIDNNSSPENTDWLLGWPEVNVVLNRTEPVPLAGRNILSYLVAHLKSRPVQRNWGSYANAIGLEIAVRLIDPRSHYLMTLHMDTMACYTGWLAFLKSKLDQSIAAAGVRMDRVRNLDGVLHTLGCLVDFQLLRHLDIGFLPQLPQYDVGDQVTVKLREAGYAIFACHNTHWEPHLIDRIPVSSPLYHLHMDRSFDDEENVIFLHLGRGIKKSSDSHRSRLSAEEWIKFADEYLLT